MKYGEIKWKVEKVVFQIDGGVITRKSEVDEGRTLIRKACHQPDMLLEHTITTACPC